ncbi:hypothetical protein D3C73_185240 [compost metagenome]
MDKRLIDADELLEWMEKSPDAEGFWQEGSMHTGNTAFDNLTDAINKGLFDPIPPTIKPGDTYQILNEVLKVVDELKLYNSNPQAHKRIMAAISGEGEVSHD